MPRLKLDQFDEEPHLGDSVTVTGKIEFIDEDNGEVEVSYDEVKITKERKKKDRKDRKEDREEEMEFEEEIEPQSQSLDSALAKAFPNTQ